MSLWQTLSWSKMLQVTHQVESIIEIWDILIQKRSIWLWQFGLFIMGISPDTLLDSVMLIDTCKKEKCVFIQVEYLNYSGSKLTTKIEQFSKWHYKKFLTPYTAIIDLELTEDEILTKMKPKWRYNIKLAKKKWITVEKVEKTKENIKIYHELSSETTKRDNFSGHTLQYYNSFLKELDNSSLYLAYKDNQAVAGWIFIFDSEISYYYYWASSSNKEFRNLMAPYLLQWEAIMHAKKIGSKVYDFLWISWEWEYFDASLSWVTDFKMKLTPNTLKVSDSYIWINKKISYNFLQLLKNIKNRF